MKGRSPGKIPIRVKAESGKGPTLATVDFPSLYIRRKSAGPKTITSEREFVVGETVSRKTEEWFNEDTGRIEIRTVEIVEKIIEHEVSHLHWWMNEWDSGLLEFKGFLDMLKGTGSWVKHSF